MENLECRTTALDTRKKMLTQVNEEIRQRNNELYSENTRLTEANSSLAAENKSLADTNAGLSEESVRLAEQRKGLVEDTDRLTAEKKAYEAQTDEARKKPGTPSVSATRRKPSGMRNARNSAAISPIYSPGARPRGLKPRLSERIMKSAR